MRLPPSHTYICTRHRPALPHTKARDNSKTSHQANGRSGTRFYTDPIQPLPCIHSGTVFSRTRATSRREQPQALHDLPSEPVGLAGLAKGFPLSPASFFLPAVRNPARSLPRRRRRGTAHRSTFLERRVGRHAAVSDERMAAIQRRRVLRVCTCGEFRPKQTATPASAGMRSSGKNIWQARYSKSCRIPLCMPVAMRVYARATCHDERC